MGVSWSNTVLALQSWYQSHKPGSSQNKVFITQIGTAVEKDDVAALKELHEEAINTGYGGLAYIQCNPPITLQAASHGHVAVLRYLLELDVDVDARDTCGMTALHIACKHGHQDCLELLLCKSRDIDKRDIWGRTPLIKALVYRNLDAAKVLLKAGANPNAVDNYGMTPLTTVINYNLIDMVRLLVHHGADINLISCFQHQCLGPPLYKAINNQNLALVQELLHLGATTQPCQSHVSPLAFSGLPSVGGLGTWPHLGLANFPLHSSLGHSLQHENAVIMAMSELVKRGDEQLTPVSLDIFMQVLAAHGTPLGPTHEVLARVLLSSRNDSLLHIPRGEENAEEQNLRSLSSDMMSMLLLKLHLCSASCHSPENLEAIIGQSGSTPSRARSPASASTSQAERGDAKPTLKRKAVSLHTQARRMVRKVMMASGHNVTWAAQRLACPPALKTLVLLKDVDRAFPKKK
ncbi:hypothetical protein EGW08_012508 [Elysia chlorotica]|uniref:Uncharacterized protein n=1 Tax=Elysia chlorotica TaxID=188477 RepID=A0A3S0ZKC8_ELYCH|nr:hypothetical protein EGW08_012508 [Elysia chlorotica]